MSFHNKSEYQTPKLTPWFTNGEKPAHVGVYNVSCRKENQSGEYYSYWDGSYFYDFSRSIDMAYKYGNSNYERGKFSNVGGSWRGLAENPEV